MKKRYITPVIVAYQIDIENICADTSQYRLSLYDGDPTDYDENDNTVEFASTAYRTTLWGE